MTVLRRRRTTVPRASIERNVAAKIFIPNHVTAVAVESSSLEWKVGYRKEQDAMGIPAEDRPELFWLVDPNDYLAADRLRRERRPLGQVAPPRLIRS